MFSLAKGYIHDATPWGVAALRTLGEKTGAFSATPTDDPSVFRLESLRRIDAVCFLNTCYTPFTDESLRQNLLDFVRGGKGYVGIHCSAHTFLDWPEFGRMQGAYSTNHPWVEQVTALVEKPEHPLMKCFGDRSFAIADEIYQFGDPYSRAHLRVLMRLDTQRTDMNKPGIFRNDGDLGDLIALESYYVHDREPSPSVLDGAKSVAAGVAAWESVRTGREVRVHNDF